MKQPINKDGTPRKRRMDCKVFLLPDEGQVEFADVLARNPSSPNVEQLEAVMARHGVPVSRNSLYEFLKSARVQEFQITAGVIRNRLLGQKLATAGADALHADARRLATGYWMTVARCAQEMDGGKRSEETAEQSQARLDRSRAEMEAATDALGTLGCLKAGEDKGAIAVAKLQLQSAKLKLDREKFETQVAEKLLDETLRARATQIADSNAPRAEKIAQLRQTYFADIDDEKVVLPK